jgi:hypothetical protein
MGPAARSVESAAGVCLGELIDFCARCAAAGIPESTKLRGNTNALRSLVAVFAESQVAMPSGVVDPGDTGYGTIIDGGVAIDIPAED